MGILNMLGLMKVEDHEDLIEKQDQANYQAWQRVCEQRDKFKQQVVDTWVRAEKAEAKFKTAAVDMAAQSDEIEALQRVANGLNAEIEKAVHDRDAWQQTATTYAEELSTLLPDAEAHRAKKAKDAAYEARRVRPARAKGVRS